MSSIGETLRRERLERHLELGDVAQILKISPRFLDAMENDQYERLPGGVFSKSFIRQYAAYLGLDADALTAEFQRIIEPRVPETEVPERSKPDVPDLRIDGYESWQNTSERRTPWSSWVTAAIVVVAVMLVCSAVAWWWERPLPQPIRAAAPPHVAPVQTPAPPPVETPTAAETKPPADSSTAQAPPTQPAAQPPVAQPPVTQPPVTQPPVTPPAATQEAAAPPPVAPPPAVLQPNPNASVRVAITANEEVWVRARANGKTVFAGTLRPNESRNVDIDGTVELLLGNAGGASIWLNGKLVAVEGLPNGAVGPKGQVRTVQFTSGGFQIVPPNAPERDLR